MCLWTFTSFFLRLLLTILNICSNTFEFTDRYMYLQTFTPTTSCTRRPVLKCLLRTSPNLESWSKGTPGSNATDSDATGKCMLRWVRHHQFISRFFTQHKLTSFTTEMQIQPYPISRLRYMGPFHPTLSLFITFLSLRHPVISHKGVTSRYISHVTCSQFSLFGIVIGMVSSSEANLL